jgi:monovalent cation/hydrogen antiporter
VTAQSTEPVPQPLESHFVMPNGNAVQSVEALFLLLLVFVAFFAGIARRLNIPYPILLVIAGLIVSLLPGMPRINLDPDLVFLVFLPPLLYAAAWALSWREFQRNFSAIAKLAFGLVFFTIVGLAIGAGRLLPGFDQKSAILLGAVVAATDAIAATSIARRLGLPQQIVDLLEAESLVNDGTGLVALQFGLLILLTGHTPGVIESVGRLVFLTGGGVMVGLAVGAAVSWFEKWVDDGGIEIIISILVPYATYLLATRMRTSGVIAVIACGMYMSRKSVTFMSPGVRLQATAVWDALTFVLNGVVFVLIGLQLPFVMGEIHGMSTSVLLRYGIGFSVAMIGVRMLWVFGETYLSYAIQRWLQKTETPLPNPRVTFIIGWGGMRGVLSLAAAVSLPYVISNGQRFPQRSMIIYLAFCLIVVTLVVQGLTMPWLIHLLGLSGKEEHGIEEQEARRVLLREAIAYLSRRRFKNKDNSGIYRELLARYQRRLDALPAEREIRQEILLDRTERKAAILAVLQVERESLIRLRDEGEISEEVLRTLQYELDLTEGRAHTGAMVEY